MATSLAPVTELLTSFSLWTFCLDSGILFQEYFQAVTLPPIRDSAFSSKRHARLLMWKRMGGSYLGERSLVQTHPKAQISESRLPLPYPQLQVQFQKSHCHCHLGSNRLETTMSGRKSISNPVVSCALHRVAMRVTNTGDFRNASKRPMFSSHYMALLERRLSGYVRVSDKGCRILR